MMCSLLLSWLYESSFCRRDADMYQADDTTVTYGTHPEFTNNLPGVNKYFTQNNRKFTNDLPIASQ